MRKQNPKLVLTKEEQQTFKKIKQKYVHLVDGPLVNDGGASVNDFDTVIESIISSKKGKNKSKQHTSTTSYDQQK